MTDDAPMTEAELNRMLGIFPEPLTPEQERDMATYYDAVDAPIQQWLRAFDALTGDPAFTRRVIDDGREPDPTTGLPLETDAEFAARIKGSVAASLAPSPEQIAKAYGVEVIITKTDDPHPGIVICDFIGVKDGETREGIERCRIIGTQFRYFRDHAERRQLTEAESK